MLCPLLFVACSSSGYDTAPASSSTVATTATSALVTTTSVGATSAATTAPPTTAAPSTTAGVSSTTLSTTEEVRAAALAYNAFYVACLRNPTACEPASGTAPDSDAFRALSTTVTQLRTGGFYVGQEDPGTTVIESIEPADGYTLVTQCHYTTMVLYGPPASEGGPPVLQNNTAGTVREALKFVQLADGTWRMSRGDKLLDKAGVNECPPV